MTIEEGSIGGFGSHVVNFLSKKGLIDSNLKFRSMTLPDIFIDQDTPENMYKIANLDSSSIEEKILDVLKSGASPLSDANYFFCVFFTKTISQGPLVLAQCKY